VPAEPDWQREIKQVLPAAKRRARCFSTYTQTTAYHEAGHAVAAFFLGIEIDHVSLYHGRDSGGRVVYQKPLPPTDSREWVVSVAGDLADARIRGPIGVEVPGLEHHLQEAAEIFGAESAAEIIETARGLVELPEIWRAIDLLAKVLLYARKLDGKVVKAIVMASHTKV